MRIGIDQMSVYIPSYMLKMDDLAHDRGQDPAKFHIGIGQDEMSVTPPSQDSVSLAMNSAWQIISSPDPVTQNKLSRLRLLIFASETGVDHSKAGSLFLIKSLGLKKNVRTMEIKQACYGATAGLQAAVAEISRHPEATALVIASDVAKYGLNSGGEPTQGAGSVAMLISADPRLAYISENSACYADDIADFWRPLDCKYPLVDGKFSNEAYIDFFKRTSQDYLEMTGQGYEDLKAICCHLPYSKMGKKALFPLIEGNKREEELKELYEYSTYYGRKVGNIYTGSLYLAFFSLLVKSHQLKAGDEIGLFSYGSGAVGEFFTMTVVEGYKEHLHQEKLDEMLQMRIILSMPAYEAMYKASERLMDGDLEQLKVYYDSALFRFEGIENGHRIYTVLPEDNKIC
ncbi:hydroxymethylglutaryl-CoA synthase [Atopobacter sp. AH10]|uniref:hydroxymethylglutaryl-CoA synthase n=1 Tax=Atopobacter sp. AH10 TaxID=2315861 RepID=UPI000EF27638|nr:hydroxymethylglutaryl-CoA synthase [Atopobacter sp. AH10]RLK63349.1 hydroxymethylglutaryl-CoA synthase [Atopobacter sp. AH10]